MNDIRCGSWHEKQADGLSSACNVKPVGLSNPGTFRNIQCGGGEPGMTIPAKDTAPPALSAALGPTPVWRIALWLGLAIVVVLAVFNRFPILDIAVTRLFHDASLCINGTQFCREFAARSSPFLVGLRTIGHYLPGVVLGAIILWSLIRVWHGAKWRDSISRRVQVLVATMLCGPVLLVNLILKEHVGRPRPFSVREFGGDLPFVVAGNPFGACTVNCSFVSGEAAGAGLLLCCLIILPPHWRKTALLFTLPLTIAIALFRIPMGAHFLSDVIIGYMSTLLVFALIASGEEFLYRRHAHRS
jgi:lipid A 4'-phosphatase